MFEFRFWYVGFQDLGFRVCDLRHQGVEFRADASCKRIRVSSQTPEQTWKLIWSPFQTTTVLVWASQPLTGETYTIN